ncbi:YjfB family protein [Saliterribacillus persicus]|uniref:Putative motility protein YjfB-like n=1 Tax=Saliterribacillus persicus TaxID=930114 RepID=A0A368Y3M5_9BACI|nr:YjfB family protein [Saliterribacillus persicus]RCW74705.1 putative motility protein YjfB-like [Saliterribacillus persicus]
MDVAAMSIIMNQAQVKQQANVKLMDNALDQARTQSADMIKMMEQSMEPHLGTSIDLKG